MKPRQRTGKLALVIGLIAVVLVILILTMRSWPATAAGSANDVKWSNPSAVALQKIASIPNIGEGRLAFEDNLNCQKISRRLNGSDAPQIGCYIATAFGSLDVGTDLISFNGNEDISVRLNPYSSQEVLLPWPGTSSMLSIIPLPGDGALLGLYRNILGVTEDTRNTLGQVVAKQVTAPADISLLDSAGHRLVVNFNSITFSDNGSWLIVESTGGLFYRINLASLTAKPLAPAFANIGAGYEQSQLAVSDDGRFVAIANAAARSFRVYDLTSCPGTSPNDTICSSYEYWPVLAGKAPNLQLPTKLRFLNSGLLSFVNITNTELTTFELAPAAGITSLLSYLALGDSFTSGVGGRFYQPGTDTAANGCMSSTYSYPSLLIADLFSSTAGHNVACSGARIFDVLPSPGYSGQVQGGEAFGSLLADVLQQRLLSFQPGHLPQASFVSTYQPAAVTLSVGGNDIGFDDILKICVAPHLNPHVTAANSCYATYEDRQELAETIDRQVPRLINLFKRLQAMSPATTIYAVGYPLIAVDTGNCPFNVHLNTTELALSLEVTKQLNNAIARAAAATSANYVSIEAALAGHRLCEASSQVAVNGITAGNDGGVSVSVAGQAVGIDFLGKESFHPNAYGYQLIEQAIMRQTSGLQLKIPSAAAMPPAAAPGSKLLQGPKTGRVVKNKQPTTVSRQRSAGKGTTLPIKIGGSEHGLRPKAPHTVSLKSGTQVRAIGVIQSNEAGDVVGNVTVPADAAGGPHEIAVDGTNQLGSPISMIDVIFVIHTTADYDGDGIIDLKDSCPTIYNSDLDTDHDGIDDACDNTIESVPVSPPPASALTVSGPTVTPPAVPVTYPPTTGTIPPQILPPAPVGIRLDPVVPPSVQSLLSVSASDSTASSLQTTSTTLANSNQPRLQSTVLRPLQSAFEGSVLGASATKLSPINLNKNNLPPPAKTRAIYPAIPIINILPYLLGYFLLLIVVIVLRQLTERYRREYG